MHRLLLTFLITLATCHPAFAASAAKESPAKARDPYPLQTCVVSGEHLEAGQTVEYVHKEPGQPDRLVRFCCRKCLARFKADPAKYLQKLDEAAAKSGKTN